MNTDLSELTLMQLSDSFFPSGLYTMSNGLETIFDEKRALSEGDVYDFLEVTLEQQLGPADSVALSNAYDCAKNEDISVGVYPVKDVVDPTGAGDVFGGGFVSGLIDKLSTFDSMVRGSALASFCIEEFGVDKLINIEKSDVERRIDSIK